MLVACAHGSAAEDNELSARCDFYGLEFERGPGLGETAHQRAARLNRVRRRLSETTQAHIAALRAGGRARIVPGHALLALAGSIVNIVGEQ